MEKFRDQVREFRFTRREGLIAAAAGLVGVGIGGSVAVLLQSSQIQELKEKVGSRLAGKKQVLGFAASWMIESGLLDNQNLGHLTGVIYHGVDIGPDGRLVRSSSAYRILEGDKTAAFFNRVQQRKADVALSFTRVDRRAGEVIGSVLSNDDYRDKAVEQIIDELKLRQTQHANIDIEPNADPGEDIRNKFSGFIAKLNAEMHRSFRNPKLKVSVYGSSVRNPNLYDVGALAKSAQIILMGYDFYGFNSERASATDPLYGSKEGKFAYDIASAVEDFEAVMSLDGLILAVPWYGYDYPVSEFGNNATVRSGFPLTQEVFIGNEHRTYRQYKRIIAAADPAYIKSGWDYDAQQAWYGYLDENDIRRQICINTPESLAHRYRFIKNRGLAGLAIWALGFEDNDPAMWGLVGQEFK